MSTDQNDAYVTSKVNIWLALFFSVNLVATLAFWAALETPASLGLYAAAMIAFTVAAFLDLRSALRYCEPEEELPVSA
jgi:hypothetical protein